MQIIIQNKEKIIFLVLILLISIFFRLWQLDKIPPWLFPDVAMYGNDGLETLKTSNFKPFYPNNNGREGLMMWLLAISFSVFGISVWSIKIVTATIGIFTVFGLYLLIKELFKFGNQKILENEKIALLASFLLAISFWHVNFSRIGFRAILLPFILVYSFYFLFKGFNNKKIGYFVLAGLFFGSGFYTYTSFRMAVLILPFLFLPSWFIYKKGNNQKIFWLSIFHFLIVVFIVALPLAFYFLYHPEDFINRAVPVSIFAKENPIMEFFKSFFLHLAMFNIYGDANWRHNYATSPQLFWPVGFLFLIGIFFSIKYLVSSIKKKDYFQLTIHSFLLSSFFIMLLPGILTYEGIPHSLRTIGVIPFTFIFAGLGGIIIYNFLNTYFKNKKLLYFVFLFFLLALLFSEYNKYFNLWAKEEKLNESFGKKYAQIGHLLNSFPNDYKKYVIIDSPQNPVYGISIDAQTPIFIESTKYGSPQSIYLKIEDINKKFDIYHRKSIIVPLYENGIFDYLKNEFIWGKIKEKNGIKYFDLSY